MKTLLPNTGLLARIGGWVLGIGVVGLLSFAGAGIRRRVVRSGSKQCVAHHAEVCVILHAFVSCKFSIQRREAERLCMWA